MTYLELTRSIYIRTYRSLRQGRRVLQNEALLAKVCSHPVESKPSKVACSIICSDFDEPATANFVQQYRMQCLTRLHVFPLENTSSEAPKKARQTTGIFITKGCSVNVANVGALPSSSELSRSALVSNSFGILLWRRRRCPRRSARSSTTGGPP